MKLRYEVIMAVVASAASAVIVSTLARPAPAASSEPNEIAGISAAQAPNPAADLAYMKAHPVPPLPGETAGIITSVTELGDQCKPQADTMAYLAPARGGDPCAAWKFTIITASGRALTVACGGIGHPCPAGQIVMPGDEGEFLYAPSDGQIVVGVGFLQFLGCASPGGYPCPASAPVSVVVP